MTSYLNFIHGEFRPAHSQEWVSSDSLGVYRHFQITDSQPLDVVEALRFAKEAQSKWGHIPFEERKEKVLQLITCLEQKKDRVAQMLSEAQGLPFDFSLEVEVNYVKSVVGHWIHEIEKLKKEEGLHLAPLGVVSLVTAWPLAFRQWIERVSLQLLLGNATLIKPSSFNPEAAQCFAQLLKDVDVMPGLVQILYGRGSSLSPLFCSHPALRAVSFVGSNDVGNSVRSLAAGAGLRLQMSLGSQNSALVLSDFTAEMVGLLVKACCVGQGQLVQNIHRIFVLEKDLNSFKDVFFAAASQFYQIQSQLKKEPTLLPLPSQQFRLMSDKAYRSFNKKLDLARQEGAKVFAVDPLREKPQSSQRDVNLAEEVLPQMIFDLPQCSVLQQEEARGPLILISSVKYWHEAVKWTNTGDLGHSALILGSDLEKAQRLAEKLEVGQVGINRWIDATMMDPYLAQKKSSYGPLGWQSQILFSSQAQRKN